MAWQTLSPVAPFNAPATAPDLDKVIILLTDGDNTQNRWTTSSTSIDARTQTACANAKAANIKVYTVRVINGNASLLQGCATKPDMYFNVQQASELNAVFSAIAQNLANLRIAKWSGAVMERSEPFVQAPPGSRRHSRSLNATELRPSAGKSYKILTKFQRLG